MKTLFIIVVALPLLMSCKSTQTTTDISSHTTTPQQETKRTFSQNDKWEMTTFKDFSAKEAGFGDRTPFIIINPDENKINGFSGCNSFGGNVVIENNTITCSKIFSTKALCMGVPEHDFFQLLNATLIFELTNNTLTFKQEEKVVMEFVKSEK